MYRHHDGADRFTQAAQDFADPRSLGLVGLLLDVEQGGYRIEEHESETDAKLLLEVFRYGLQLLRQGLNALRRIEIGQLPDPCDRDLFCNAEMGQGGG